MLKQTLIIVSYLVGSLLIGIVITLLVDSAEDAAVEKRICNTVEDNIKNAVASFKESAVHPTSHDEKSFIIKFVDTVMVDKAVSREHARDGMPSGSRYLTSSILQLTVRSLQCSSTFCNTKISAALT